MKKISLILVILFTLFIVSCGDSDKKESDDETTTDNETEDVKETSDETTDEAADEVTDEEVDDETTDDAVTPITCADFADGLNEGFFVGEGTNELERSFYLRLPENVDSKDNWPVVFLFHGYGDSAPNFEKLLTGKVNNSDMPFILVTPVARKDLFTFDTIPPKGLDWDMINLTDGSAEADLFDGVLTCLEEKYGTDEDHVHVAGFSAGSITSDSIGVLRPNKVASIFTYSGAYFSNELNREDLGEIMGMKVGDFFTWPDFEEGHNKYPQVLISGAEDKDTWGASGFTIYFEHMAVFDANYLTEKGHNVILCNHGGSHTTAGLNSSDMITFFKDHPKGTNVSPYKDGLPEGWSDICEYRDQPVELPDNEVGDDVSEMSDETNDDDSV